MPIRYDADRSRHPWNFISLAMFLFDLAVHNHFWNFHWATFRLLITRCIFFWSSAESIVLLSAYHLARIFLGIWITLASANLAILRQCQLYFLTGYLREIEVIILRKRVENISWFFSIFFPSKTARGSAYYYYYFLVLYPLCGVIFGGADSLYSSEDVRLGHSVGFLTFTTISPLCWWCAQSVGLRPNLKSCWEVA